MADNEESDVMALTHITLRDRPRRQWAVNDFKLPGLNLPSLYASLGVFVTLLVLVAGLHTVLGGNTLTIGFVVTVVVAILAYFVWGTSVSDLGGAGLTMLFWADYRFRQPRVIHGSTANREPNRVRWQTILWEPTDPGWLARRDATYRWLIEHPPGDSAIGAARASQEDSTDSHVNIASGGTA